MKKHLEQMLVGITASVVFGVILFFMLAVGNLSATPLATIVRGLPLAFAMGAAIGILTSFIYSDGCLVMVGTMLGWLLGAIATTLLRMTFNLPDNFDFIVWMVFGVFFGLVPSLLARIRLRR